MSRLECRAIVLDELRERAWLPVQEPLDLGARLVTRNLGICHGYAERFNHPRGQSKALQLPDEVSGRHVQVSDGPTKYAGKHSRLRVAVKQFRAVEVVGFSGMPLLG
jgi:hypothetical protein